HTTYLYSFPTRRSSDLFRDSLSIYALTRMGDIEGAVASSLGYEQGASGLESSFQAQNIRKRIIRGSSAIALFSGAGPLGNPFEIDRKSTRLNSSHVSTS